MLFSLNFTCNSWSILLSCEREIVRNAGILLGIIHRSQKVPSVQHSTPQHKRPQHNTTQHRTQYKNTQISTHTALHTPQHPLHKSYRTRHSTVQHDIKKHIKHHSAQLDSILHHITAHYPLTYITPPQTHHRLRITFHTPQHHFAPPFRLPLQEPHFSSHFNTHKQRT